MINFEFGLVVQETLFKIFLIWSSGRPRVQWSKTNYVILVGAILGTFMQSNFTFGPVAQKKRCRLNKKVYRRRTKTDHNSSPLALASGELKWAITQ